MRYSLPAPAQTVLPAVHARKACHPLSLSHGSSVATFTPYMLDHS